VCSQQIHRQVVTAVGSEVDGHKTGRICKFRVGAEGRQHCGGVHGQRLAGLQGAGTDRVALLFPGMTKEQLLPGTVVRPCRD
jgi:hypothetical protein